MSADLIANVTAEIRSRYFHSGKEYQTVFGDCRERRTYNCRNVANNLILWFIKNFRVSQEKQSNIKWLIQFGNTSLR